jgi:lantibiotic biosynthesis protein
MNNDLHNIENQIWNSVNVESRIGALDGLSGIALLYSYLAKVTNDDVYHKKLLHVIDRVNTLISKNEYDATFCSGIAGYGWVLLKIKDEHIEIDDDYFTAIDLILIEALDNDSINDYYDFLHGAMGIALYFIEKYNFKKEKNIELLLIKFTNELLNKINSQTELLFSNYSENTEKKLLYFGLAHGISGYLNFIIYLKKTLQNLVPDIDQSLISIINFIKKFKSYDNESKQFYPAQVDIENNNIINSRLGWCQGDLGMGNAIYNTGIYLNNAEIIAEGVELINNTKKISFINSKVKDFAICHGSSGIILQYYLDYKKTAQNNSLIIDTWYKELKDQTNNFVDFKSFFIDEYVNETNVLNGSAGFALVILSIENQIELDWINCLNLF